jgi:hypothetical protein
VDTRCRPEIYAVTKRRPAVERYPPSEWSRVALRNWDRRLWAPRLLLLSAIFICGIAVWKAVDDRNEKEFIKSAVIGTLSPTPDVINRISDDMQKLVSNEGYEVDYSKSRDGMVLYLKRHGPKGFEHFGTIILSNSDLSKLSADVILKEDTSTLLQNSRSQHFDFSGYNEDLYSLLCALFTSSVRRVLYKILSIVTTIAITE